MRHIAKCKVQKKQSRRIDELAKSLSKNDGREAKKRKLEPEHLELERPTGISKQMTSKSDLHHAELEAASPSATSQEPGPSQPQEITQHSPLSTQVGIEDHEGIRSMEWDMVDKESVEVPATSQHDSVCLGPELSTFASLT